MPLVRPLPARRAWCNPAEETPRAVQSGAGDARCGARRRSSRAERDVGGARADGIGRVELMTLVVKPGGFRSQVGRLTR
jgi:hypothetical protein